MRVTDIRQEMEESAPTLNQKYTFTVCSWWPNKFEVSIILIILTFFLLQVILFEVILNIYYIIMGFFFKNCPLQWTSGVVQV